MPTTKIMCFGHGGGVGQCWKCFTHVCQKASAADGQFGFRFILYCTTVRRKSSAALTRRNGVSCLVARLACGAPSLSQYHTFDVIRIPREMTAPGIFAPEVLRARSLHCCRALEPSAQGLHAPSIFLRSMVFACSHPSLGKYLWKNLTSSLTPQDGRGVRPMIPHGFTSQVPRAVTESGA